VTRRLLVALLIAAAPAAAAQADPERLTDLFDRREARIPMRDGVALNTVIYAPKAGPDSLPFILIRTPYGVSDGDARLGAVAELVREGYIFVLQDIRGRYRSAGTFVMNRPPCATRGPGCIDEATDTWDTIDWLLANVPGHNGRVGQLGISYPGYLTNATAFEPHPALKALSPQATMGDTWMGDDFFHQGAFRLSYGLEYASWMEASSDGSGGPAPDRYDTYDWYRRFPTLAALAAAVGADAWPTWRRFVAHPAYDTAWSVRSMARRLPTPTVPTLTVGGWWDQLALAEDVTLAGDVVARLFASTTGTDADWVVKLIDVYPDTVPEGPAMGGYQLMVAGDIMRGRYHGGWDAPAAIPTNTVTGFTVDLHQQSYTFRRGHRIMVQVQITWFPLYDRNPQTFVRNIFLARAGDYRAQTHRIQRTARHPSHVEMDVLPR
jgi:predicted acyl esterase